MSFGHAVGPQWASQLPSSLKATHITLEYGVEVTAIHSNTLHQAEDGAWHSTAQCTAWQDSHHQSSDEQSPDQPVSGQQSAAQQSSTQQSTAQQSMPQQSAAHESTSQPPSSCRSTESQAGHDSGEGTHWPVTVCLSNGKSYGADLVISAIGVEPNTAWLPEEIKRDPDDGGIIVDRCSLMRFHHCPGVGHEQGQDYCH